ncbi:hypothetical protein [Paenibacillus lutimineralis]|uniref:Copper amine oxidase n=1 Tax=Paenibacillus lutimineralis TaxID=2707005 RepID=A0A3Q9I745_9BACL|nr:hypothetical protein [Paenibacillus lutimineralis]AZS13985.1 hypothetical protein EI981_05655 [Paenibacillus lutimineralis]
MKKIKKIFFLLLCFMILQSGTILFAAVNKSEISFYLNNVFQKREGLIINGDILLSTEQLSEDLFALFSSDELGETVRIYKPNVNLVLLDNNDQVFGKVKSNNRVTFSTLVQVDNLKTKISDLKITITSPAGKTETISSEQIKDSTEYFWFRSENFTYTFSTKDNYIIRVYFKDMDTKKWSPVSEIQIIAI